MNTSRVNCKSDPVSRLTNASKIGLGLNDVMLEVGPARLTVSDLWTLIPPNISSRHSFITNSIKGFVGGWLVDKVISVRVFVMRAEHIQLAISLSSLSLSYFPTIKGCRSCNVEAN